MALDSYGALIDFFFQILMTVLQFFDIAWYAKPGDIKKYKDPQQFFKIAEEQPKGENMQSCHVQ
jgi:hypothetical protein